jgi:hypothetical protein
MADEEKTPAKPRKNLKRGAKDGKPFTADNQPDPALKSEGWKKLRAERLLTQAILAHMTKGKNLQSYISSLYANAKKGNPKAIETINKGIEDDVIKIAATDSQGEDLIDVSKLPTELLQSLLNAKNQP